MVDLGPGGDLFWSATYPAPGATCDVVIADPSGGFVVAGTYGAAGLDLLTGPLPPVTGSGSTAGWIAAMNATGPLRFTLGSGGSGITQPLAAVVDGAGDILIAGSFDTQVTFGGVTVTSPNGNMNALVLKLAADGTVLSFQGFGAQDPSSLATATGIAISGSGAPVVAGQLLGQLDLGAGATLQGAVPTPYLAQLPP
jgi:hypothetical protein